MKKAVAILLTLVLAVGCFAGVLTSAEEAGLSSDVKTAVVEAFKDYVSEKGNAAEKAALVTAVGNAISSYTVTVEDDDYFIYHAVDGCYDEATENKLSIPGHDGYVSAIFTVSDSSGNTLGTVGAVAHIPHTEENFGTLTTTTDADFTVSNGVLTAYNGTAEKVVIPDGVTKITLTANDKVFVTAKVLIIPSSVTSISNAAFRSYASGVSDPTNPGNLTGGWTALKAVVVKGSTTIGENAFVRDYSLKYLDISNMTSSSQAYINDQAFGMCYSLENVLIGSEYLNIKTRVFRYTPVRSFYLPQYFYKTTSADKDAFATPSFSGGTRSIMTYAEQQSATLARAATLAQEKADAYSATASDTADTVKAAIIAGYSDKTVTSEITADWNGTFTSSAGTVSGTLTLTQGEKSVDVDYYCGSDAGSSNELPEGVTEKIENALTVYVDNKGNNSDPDKLLAYINNAIAPAKVAYATDGVYIRHAVDGVYDVPAEGDDYPIEIKGHDGYVAVNLKIYNSANNLCGYYGGIACIPHTEENLGTLDYEIYVKDDDDGFGDGSSFETDSDGNITGYSGKAEKIIIPKDFSGKIDLKDNVDNMNSIKAVVIGGSDTASMTLDIANYAFSGWDSLRAVELPRKICGRIGQFAFAYNPVLKYVDMPNNIAKSDGSGYGTLENEAFRECPVLENIASNNAGGRITTGQIWKMVFYGTAVRDYILEDWYQYGSSASLNSISSNPSYTEGRQNKHEVGANRGGTVAASFTRAVTMAQEKADTYMAVTAENATEVMTAVTGAYGARISGVTAQWADDDYSAINLTYGNYTIPIVFGRQSYDVTLKLEMNDTADFRFGTLAGLRFGYTVSGLDEQRAAEAVEKVRLGTIIVPADLIDTEVTHFALNTAGKAYIDVTAKYISGNTVKTVLSNIKESNYNRELAAMGYAEITYTDGTVKYVYASDCVTARPAEAAAELLSGSTVLTEAQISYLEAIVDTAAEYTANYIDTAYGNSDTAAYALRTAIAASSSAEYDTSVYNGTVYKIDEQNFETQITQLSSLSGGSVVLFERGGTYRVGSINVSADNIYFGDYGTGAKPNIYGSEKNFATESWTADGTNIWCVSGVTGLDNNDAGIVVFDNGKAAGNKVAQKSDIAADGDFWFDSANDKLYLYSTQNPSARWSDIEIGADRHIFNISGKNNITVDNLCLRYGGAHGVAISGAAGVTVSNCEIGYIGGAYNTKSGNSRYGNGVELWCGGEDITVENCWIHQIYDSGLTNQGTGTASANTIFTQKNITFRGNLIEYCGFACIEYWTSASGSSTEYNRFENISYTDNICRFAGYGLGAAESGKPGYTLYTTRDALNAIKEADGKDTLYVSGNIFDTARGGLMQLSGCHYISAMPQLSGNSYMQHSGAVLGVLASEYNNGSVTATTTYYFDSSVASNISAKFKDTSATVVTYK